MKIIWELDATKFYTYDQIYRAISEGRYHELMWLAVDAQRMGYRKAARMLVRIAGKYYANRSK